MNCANHSQTSATAYCRTCGKPLCPACQRVVQGVIYCETCLAERLGAIPQAPGVAPAGPAGNVPGVPVVPVPAAPESGHVQSPGMAALLGFIPGVGAIYNGQFVKGIAHVAIFIALIVATSNLPDNVAWMPGLGIAFWIFYMVYDAYQTARARELGRPLPDPFGFENLWEGGRRAYSIGHAPAGASATQAPGAVPAGATEPGQATEGVAPAPGSVPGAAAYSPDVPSRPAAPVGAIILIALGALFLLNSVTNAFWWWNRYWFPAALIALGIWIFFRRRSRPWACGCSRCESRALMAPAMLTLTGVLWLVGEVSNGRWTMHETWPLYLIVAGAILVLRHSSSGEGHIPYNERAAILGQHVEARFNEKLDQKIDKYQSKVDQFQDKRDRFQEKMDRFQQRMDDMRGGEKPEANQGPEPGTPNDEVHNG